MRQVMLSQSGIPLRIAGTINKVKLLKFLNNFKLPLLIGTTSLLSGCSLTVPLLVFSGNGEDIYRGTATGYLDGSGTIKFSGTKFDVDCNSCSLRILFSAVPICILPFAYGGPS